jgi:hypothetical protein
MTGGLMNLVSSGQQNILLNGNPSKSFFKSTYLKYTNFGLQKFRIDYEGSTTLRLSEESTFTFKILRYAELLMDCYLSVDLPNIWSPIIPPLQNSETIPTNSGQWVPYEFQWIENLGAQMISRISITCGNQLLQEYSGAYLLASVQRDFSTDKKNLFDKMIGNITELNDPANYGTNNNNYPNAYYTSNPAGAEPSIRGRTLYIPINSWFSLKSQQAFPLVALQYNQLQISITMRPIQELFKIRDVYDAANNYPLIAPNFNLFYMQFYRFLQTPPDIDLGVNSYTDTRTIWNANIHLNCTYCFLSNDESRLFALNEQNYMIKQISETIFYNVTGPNKLDLDSMGMTYNYTFFMQRSDVNLRNEWSNYTNWAYKNLPYSIVTAPITGDYSITYTQSNGSTSKLTIGPGINSNQQFTGLYLTGNFNFENTKDILLSLAILLDGSYRENTQAAGIYNYIEKYVRTSGNAPDGLYFYNFGIHSSNFDLQPSGAINMSRFTNIQFEINTIVPPLDPLAQTLSICDPQTGQIIGINKPTWRIYNYNFNLVLFQERMNQVKFVGGNCALVYAQ